MALFNPILRPDQAHAARILVQVTQDYLGKKSGLGTDIVRAFEEGRSELEPSQQTELRSALESLGAVFIPEDDDAGHGVRLKFNSRKVRSLQTWEGEGGPAYPDAVPGL